MKRIEIFDSTLRDGAQGEGISFSVEDKLAITSALDELGVAYIEAGNPGSNPKDLEFFTRAGNLRHAKLCAFGSTRRAGNSVEKDANVLSLEQAGTPAVAIFGKSWDLHVTDVIRTSLDENLNMIRETIAYFKTRGREVIFDAEHFFDGYAENKDYAFAALRAACEGGADVLCLCDTRGAAYLTDIGAAVADICRTFGRRVAIHCHNDTGMAVAGSMVAVDAGAAQVQGTLLGIGERCGNTNLATIIANLQTKRGFSCVPDEQLAQLTPTVRRVAEIANVTLAGDAPYVGKSAFAHKGGMHIDGVMKLPRSFEHIDPDAVGNERRFLLSEVSGRTTVLAAVQRIDPTLTKDSPEVKAVVARIKELEFEGYQFEGAQATVELLIRKVLGVYKPFFELEQYKIIGEQPPVGGRSDTAVIRLRAFGKSEISAAQGDGPVHALDIALKKALTVFYPAVQHIRLTDYKVRVMESRSATASKVRVLIETTDGTASWTTVGVSTDIIAASWIALVDSIEYKLTRDEL
ncbi:citramalate synthase [Ethanoligenens harbinense]|uniref:Citramalate synthase n=1 Tax=Ethanoligenens harbinense (strain DSM 18485 / JCM 12961 / CGMCC 1.5033 / YUAN-3) TaxID=663278 RepID=E6U3S0_ETHHY|nr:citramalate synthase [Ethanoligenens harbinense]ADU26487.1 2-isopropylmalate synthase/homocitrate synthase family protein [Ethanoligenens harbinense YUAN-3]AVQ95615.1 citramalate synthase [Ethanoligenens harbinense YUAN-3]AYF38279.1 citramalate synthase [Ethanoligenens harbinense]AYF41025.1 citramalate synthase [Ethanoligenens harbinense]QCN91855.1 citramalate synthase [Ethanoligenens harbinense]